MPPRAETNVTSRPSKIHVIPSASTINQCHRLQGSRSRRSATSVSTYSGGAHKLLADRSIRQIFSKSRQYLLQLERVLVQGYSKRTFSPPRPASRVASVRFTHTNPQL